MRRYIICVLGFFLASSVYAVDRSSFFETMKSGGFFGLGGSYNTVKFTQFLELSGDNNVYQDDVLVASGEAGGPAIPYYSTQATFSPFAQLGYVHHIYDSNWLCGFKFVYRYIGLNFSYGPVDSPQVGQLTSADGVTDSFTGHEIIGSSQANINNQLSLLLFGGYTFADQFSVYIGGSPVLTSSQMHLYNVIGFADINGVHFDVTGNPIDLSNALWMWGGSGEIGLNYNCSENWFINLSYNYAITGKYAIDNVTDFETSTVATVDIGTAYTSTIQRFISQAISVSINFLF